MTIVDTKSKDVVFSYTCKKQSQNMDTSSAFATSVAECLAKHWKENSTVNRNKRGATRQILTVHVVRRRTGKPGSRGLAGYSSLLCKYCAR